MKRRIAFELNGDRLEADVESWWTLLYFIRKIMGLTGTKEGCSMGECGACTVIVNGDAIASCLFPMIEVDGGKVWTIEGLNKIAPQDIHFLQRAFLKEGAVQCG